MEHRKRVALPGFSRVQREQNALWINSGAPSRGGLLYQANKDARWRQERIAPDWCRYWRWPSRGGCVAREWRGSRRNRGGHSNRWFALPGGRAFVLRTFLGRR